ncbi:DsbC/DsbD-like thiol-disulfide interchange protein [Amaricoccus macauensis]|uniref:DsbC/DsbD-like thiol-disulfide interchange protein n=1 Tax=Amaricoccus macauensis TaxID=57001 RepID=A0A840SI00_9RHOB|nr:protein-disulfide reductase DsbD domain-containing protein [Amaricoccus macauensis]MBB5222639.1 DsbC/DsbD-like thiol-disulfide interchange protein [Amaricoccus macauensis]
MHPIVLATAAAGLAIAAPVVALAEDAVPTPATAEEAGPAAAAAVIPEVSRSVASIATGIAAAAAPGMRLLSGWRAPDGSRVAAIEIALAPGWHTYWRIPGEAGIPPRFDWSESRNLAAVSYEWPRPIMFETEGMQTFGYEQKLVLPVRLRPADPSAPMEITLEADFGVCSDICIAAEASAELALAPDAAEDGRHEIETALAQRAQSAAEAGVVRATCTLTPGADGDEIIATVTFAQPTNPGEIALIEPGRPDIWIGTPQSSVEGLTLTASAPMEALGSDATSVIARDDMRLTVLGPDRVVDIRGCEAPG